MLISIPILLGFPSPPPSPSSTLSAWIDSIICLSSSGSDEVIALADGVTQCGAEEEGVGGGSRLSKGRSGREGGFSEYARATKEVSVLVLHY